MSYGDVAGYMQTNGVDPRLLPLVILTEFGGGVLVLVGLKTRWAAVALGGFCLVTALLIHWRAGEMIEVQKNVAMAGGFLTLAVFGPGPWSLELLAQAAPARSASLQLRSLSMISISSFARREYGG